MSKYELYVLNIVLHSVSAFTTDVQFYEEIQQIFDTDMKKTTQEKTLLQGLSQSSKVKGLRQF